MGNVVGPLRLAFVAEFIATVIAAPRVLRPQTPRRAVATGFVGCYGLFAGRKALDTAYYNASPRVRLDTAVFEIARAGGSPLIWRIMRRLDSMGRPKDPSGVRRPPPFAWWVDSLSDSLHISFVDGFSGAVVVLASRAVADTLHGRIEEHWDFGPPFVVRRGAAWGIPVPCVAP